MKQCKECGENKSLDNYYKQFNKKFNKDYYKTTCKVCYIKNQTIRNWEKYNIKITYDEYEERYKKTDGRCNICSDKYTILEVDHCHDTGDIRGLLCGKCNRGIGLLGDNINGIKNALSYFKML